MDEAKRLGEYNSVGGSSTHVLFNFPGYGALYMGSLISLSYSTFRDKTPVYNLGNTNIDGFAMGKRYVAGSIIKTMFMNDDLRQFLTKIKTDIGLKSDIDSLYALTKDSFKTYHNLLIDDIIPFDIIILLSSEYGAWSVSEVIYGATFINTGQVYSISDIITETTMSFIANDVKMTHSEVGSHQSSLISQTSDVAASNLPEIPKSSNLDKLYDVSKLTYSELTQKINNGELPRSALSEWNASNVSNGSTNLDESRAGSSYSIPTNNTSSSATIGTQVLDIKIETLVKDNITNGVENIHDGDTFSFNVNGESIRFRLASMDTPETETHNKDNSVKMYTQKNGEESKQFAKDYLSSGKWDNDVRSGAVKVIGQDPYGRVLLYNKNYVLESVSKGMSYYDIQNANTSGISQSDIKEIAAAQEAARKAKTGIWSGDAPFLTPKEWRNMTAEEQKEYIDRYGA